MYNHLATTANELAHVIGSGDVFGLERVGKGRGRGARSQR
jgi:hypothetical protein